MKQEVRATSDSLGTSVSLINFNNLTAIFVNTFADMIKKLRYMNIGYPSNLILFFELSVKQPFIRVPKRVIEEIPQEPLSGNFKLYDKYSSFLLNLWQPIIILCIILTILGLVCFQCMITTKYKGMQSILIKARKLLKWNFSLTFFTSYFGDIVLYSSFELEMTRFDSAGSIISFILCFIINFVVFLSFAKMLAAVSFRRLYEARENVQRKLPVKAKLTEYSTLDKFEVVLKSSKHTTFIQQGFLFIFVARLYIFVSVVSYLSTYSLAQAIISVLLCVIMLLYLAIVRPLKSRIDPGQKIMQEIVMFIIKICVLILSCFDKADKQNYKERESLGEVILEGNIALKAIGLVYLGIKTIITLSDIIKTVYPNLKNKNAAKQDMVELL